MNPRADGVGEAPPRASEGRESARRGGPRPLVIGLTGPIGCGKSTVAGWLAERGAVVVDADRLAREVVEPGQPALDAVVAAFGAEILGPDGSLDRAALARRVFADPAELRRLEAIIHPAVRPRILADVAAAATSGAQIVVLEAIRLVEAGYAGECDEVWLVVCDPSEQRERLLARGFESSDAARRIDAQAGMAARVQPSATRVIDTSGSPADAEGRVVAALAASVGAAGSPA